MVAQYRPLWWHPWLEDADLPSDVPESPDVTGYQVPEMPDTTDAPPPEAAE